jgi:hypothetical protein
MFFSPQGQAAVDTAVVAAAAAAVFAAAVAALVLVVERDDGMLLCERPPPSTLNGWIKVGLSWKQRVKKNRQENQLFWFDFNI